MEVHSTNVKVVKQKATLLQNKFLSDKQGELYVKKKENGILLETAEAIEVIEPSNHLQRMWAWSPVSIHFEASSQESGYS